MRRETRYGVGCGRCGDMRVRGDWGFDCVNADRFIGTVEVHHNIFIQNNTTCIVAAAAASAATEQHQVSSCKRGTIVEACARLYSKEDTSLFK